MDYSLPASSIHGIFQASVLEWVAICFSRVSSQPRYQMHMYGCEIWTIKKSKRWSIYAFELRCWKKTLGNPLDSKEVQPVHPKGNQSWTFIGRTDVEAETFPILWPPNAKTFLWRSFLIGKDPDDGKDWRQEEKGLTEDEMVLWHHRLNGYEFE